MIRIRWTTWRHDLLVGVLASLATTSVLVPISWAAVSDHREQAEVARRMAQAAALLAEQKAAEADQQRAQAQRNLVDQAANFAVGDKSQAEVFRVTTDA